MARLGLLALLAGLLAPSAGAADVPDFDYDILRTVPVQAYGRMPPLDTLARTAVAKVTGTETWEGHDPVGVMLAWRSDPATWRQEPLITIGNAALREALELPDDRQVFSFDELLRHAPFMRVVSEARTPGRATPPDPLEKKALKIHEQLEMLAKVMSGELPPLVPATGRVTDPWRSLDEVPPGESAALDAARTSWRNVLSAIRTGDADGYAQAARQLVSDLAALPAAYRPPAEVMAQEVSVNQLEPFHWGWVWLFVGAGLALLSLLLSVGLRGGATALLVVLDLATLAAVAIGFGWSTFGLWQRWEFAGRIPAANMYESLLFLSWGAALFAIIATVLVVFTRRWRSLPVTAAPMGAIALLLAQKLPLDRAIGPVAPVLLDTYWMAIHVPIIMVSYSVLAIAVLIAHVQLVTLAVAPRATKTAQGIDRLHYWYVAAGAWLLLTGIITGSMWGASSWGRYWGWDPKEVWSLIAFLAYMAILHVRVDREGPAPWMYGIAAVLTIGLLGVIIPLVAPLTLMKVVALGGAVVAGLIFVLGRGLFATATKSIIAFWLIIMTYVGVNYVLGAGLHSYGFGTGPVVGWMYFIGGCDLAVILACALVYLLRVRLAGLAEAPSTVTPQTT